MSVSKNLLQMLKNPGLLRDQAYIDGRWATSGTKRFDVTNPSTGEILANLPDQARHDATQAIDAAHRAFPGWAALTGKERGGVLHRLYELMTEHENDLAILLTAEMGKPLAEARGEIRYGAAYVQWFSEEAKRVYGDTIPGHQRDKRILVIRQPVGVVAAITPWNFPNAMLARKLAPALATGCTMVAKPATETPLSAIALAVLAEQAGVPAGVFNIILSQDAPAIGQEFTENTKVRKLTFTGSTEVGRILMRQGATQIMKLGLELGGNAPLIVFDDADLDKAVEGAMVSKYRNNGQTCVCANRLYVQDGIYEAFAARLAQRVAALKVGDGFEPGVEMGPLIDQNALAKVESHIADALEKGASVRTGGARSAKGGLFFEPTILTNVTGQMRVAHEETFGPVAPLFRFKTEAEALSMANDTEFGLAAYFFSSNLSRVFRVAESLEYGMVGINTGLISTEVAPFGGIKQSGLGREGSRYGIEDYTELKYLCLEIDP
ncbi:Succinate-semialdehyde dehydrogenase/glutarate-semialdehyde dehydrogenase OS=Castellaniella defragrans OX=75697 GN=HNR28_001799 PE=3 SV=1 [Castellaniella defragrans]